ncbi:gamma-glutamylcyclotransferase family protein [Chloroflexota bacterium]
MYYFAYGSNLSRRQMAERCPNAQPKFTATLPNYKLIFTGWLRKWHGGVASIKPFQGEKVVGAVYEIYERDLGLLDKHEGYPATYNRLNKMVVTEDGDRLETITYIKQEQSEETRPSLEYLTLIQQGYKDWGIV